LRYRLSASSTLCPRSRAGSLGEPPCGSTTTAISTITLIWQMVKARPNLALTRVSHAPSYPGRRSLVSTAAGSSIDVVIGTPLVGEPTPSSRPTER
jgi:hypothetical protein